LFNPVNETLPVTSGAGAAGAAAVAGAGAAAGACSSAYTPVTKANKINMVANTDLERFILDFLLY
jgi:homoserine kinase